MPSFIGLHRAALAVLLALGLASLAAPAALADGHEAPADATVAEPDTAGSSSGEVAATDVDGSDPMMAGAPDADASDPSMAGEPAAPPPSQESSPEEDGWQYSTGYFFALTRGLEELSLSTRARRGVMILTVPLDIAMLPTAAIAGLYGT